MAFYTGFKPFNFARAALSVLTNLAWETAESWSF